MSDFIWRGPLIGLSLPDGNGGTAWEGIAAPGKRLSGLPAEHPRVVALVAQKLLMPAPTQTADAATAAPAKSTARQTAAKKED